MRRHAALIPLTHDHHHGLAQSRRLQLASELSAEERLVLAQEFLTFFDHDTLEHFRNEEEVVFPLVVGEPEAEEHLSQLMLEHLRIHAFVGALRAAVERKDVDAPALEELGTLLAGHIRYEEKVLFPFIERAVPDVLLRDISLPARNRSQASMHPMEVLR